MKNRSFSHPPFKLLVIGGSLLLFSALGALALLSIKMDSLDSLNLDLSGYLTAPEYPFKSEVVEVTLSSYKRGHNGDEGLAVEDVTATLKEISKEKPRAIVLALGTPEIKGSRKALDLFVKESEKIPNLFYYSRWGQPTGGAFNNTEPFSAFSRQIGNKYAIDTKLGGKDNKSRRLVLSMNGVDYDDELVGLSDVMGLQLPALERMEGSFKLFNSIQVYLRFYSESSMKDLEVSREELSRVKGKIVFVGTRDAHSSLLGIHPFSRFDFFPDETTEHYYSEPSYLSTVYSNLKAASYVKLPGRPLNQLWLMVVLFTQLVLLWLFSERPLAYLCASFGALAVTWIVSIVSFAVFSVMLDFARAALGIIILQYIGVPFLFLRFLRKADQIKLEQIRYIEQQKIKNRFVLRAARADASLKIAAKISHDIRNPLMALQMATRFIKGQVSEDLEALMRESTLRLQGIADSALTSYKEVSSSVEGKTDISLATKELVESFRQLYPYCVFEVDLEEDLKCFVPKYSLQRCMSNIIMNALEAPAVMGRSRKINLTAESDVNSIALVVRDNGPGISAEIAGRLFQEGVTHGKKSGTGLGLYQVKEELNVYGATVAFSSSSEGAVFEIALPLEVPCVTFKTSKNVLVFEEGGELYRHLASTDGNGQINFIRCQSLKDAESYIDKIRRASQEWTVFIDLSINSDDETGLDLLEKIDPNCAVKIVLVTSLDDFPEMKSLLERHNAICISKSRLSYMKFSLRK
ncbi:ATP-binding protein [Bdellovibrio bacteriovorus]|uniref:ATP-binding protein n=1 Tax=Bdellovibrio bacteriovorus TaxID=959 RepID=UPI0035A5DC37